MNKALTLPELFGGLNARLFDMSDYIRSFHFIVIGKEVFKTIDFYASLEEIKNQIFKFPLDEAVRWLDLILIKVERLLESEPYSIEDAAGINLENKSVDQAGLNYEAEYMKLATEIEGELSTYYYTLEAIRSQLLQDEQRMVPVSPAGDTSYSVKREWLRYNLSVAVIAAINKAGYEYFPDPLTKPIKEYKYERDFHRAVVSSILPVNEEQMSFKSYEVKYNSHSVKQIAATKTAIDVLNNWTIALRNLHADMVNAPDKSTKKRKKRS